MDEVTVLPVGPWALAAVSLVLVVALAVPAGGPRIADLVSGPSPIARRSLAALALLAALTAVAVARLGPRNELDNPVPALVVGLGWPLLLLVPALVGLLRPRFAGPEDRDDARPGAAPQDDARPAVLAALAIVAFLTLPYQPTATLAVGYAVAAYATVVVAVAIAFGRAATAARFEVLGLLARWAGLGRTLARWDAPRGALAVLAVLLGGAWFERYERTTAWTQGLPDRKQAAVGLLVALTVAAVGAALMHRAVRSGPRGTAAAVLLPLVLTVAAAGVLRRALVSVQVLLYQVVGPRPFNPDPLGIAGGQALALGMVTLGGTLAGVVLARRMGPETARLPGLGVLLLLSAVSAWVVLQP